MGVGENYWGRLQRRRVSRRRFLAGGGVAAVGSAALLAGCGGDPPAPIPTEAPAPTRTPSPAAPTATPTPLPTTTPTATPTPDPHAYRRGGTLRLWKTEEDAGLDPGVYHVNNRDVIYSTLTQPMTYQPSRNLFAMDGMVGFEQVDPVTLVWSIRPGMRFHNGDAVDSEAVAFSFGRLAKLNEVLQARDDGATHVRREGYDFVDSFEPADDLTLTEHWSRPNADALVHRARHYYSFLNPRVVEEGTLEGTYTAPDGTTEDVFSVQDLPFGSGSGPYVLTKRDETGTRVERWPGYHKHIPAGDGFVEDGPYIDAWETRMIPDWVAAKAAFLAGDLDVFASIGPEELAEFEEVDHAAVVEMQVGGFSHLAMDGAKFHDKRARQALQKAFDYAGFLEDVRPRGGQYSAPISNLMPHFQQLSQEELTRWYRHDPKEARALWAAAVFEKPVEKIRIYYSYGSPLQDTIASFIEKTLSATLGVEAEAAAVDSAGSLEGALKVLGWDSWDLLNYGTGEWGGTTGIPNDSHLQHYDPRRYGGRVFNHGAKSPHPEVATDAAAIGALLEAQEQETNFEARVKLLTEIQHWILDRHWCNWALPIDTAQYYGFSSRLRDHAPDDWRNHYDLRRESMWLADA